MWGENTGEPAQEECRPEGPGGMCTPGLRREEIHLDAGYLGGETRAHELFKALVVLVAGAGAAALLGGDERGAAAEEGVQHEASGGGGGGGCCSSLPCPGLPSCSDWNIAFTVGTKE